MKEKSMPLESLEIKHNIKNRVMKGIEIYEFEDNMNKGRDVKTRRTDDVTR